MRIWILALFMTSSMAHSHSGGLDSKGGHSIIETGIYHCHSCDDKATQKYDRGDWIHWVDVDGDCQNERQEILIEYSTEPVTFTNDKQCTVKTGFWYGAYTGESFKFASELDIDHIVPLSHAHKTGGASWSKRKKRQFANDRDNLLPVDDRTNRVKSDKSPVNWMPPRRDYWCEYISKWTRIKDRYNLQTTAEEKAKIDTVIGSCP